MPLSFIDRAPQAVEQDSKKADRPVAVDLSVLRDQLQQISDLKLDDLLTVSATQFEQTVRGLFSMIKDIEGAMADVLKQQADLRAEAMQLGDANEHLAQKNQDLRQSLTTLENATFPMRDLEKRLELLIEETERFKALYKMESARVLSQEELLKGVAAQRESLHEECHDACREIVVLNHKQEAVKKQCGLDLLQKKIDQVQTEKNRVAADLGRVRKELTDFYRSLGS